jgi:hypothetical protein
MAGRDPIPRQIVVERLVMRVELLRNGWMDLTRARGSLSSVSMRLESVTSPAYQSPCAYLAKTDSLDVALIPPAGSGWAAGPGRVTRAGPGRVTAGGTRTLRGGVTAGPGRVAGAQVEDRRGTPRRLQRVTRTTTEE